MSKKATNLSDTFSSAERYLRFTSPQLSVKYCHQAAFCRGEGAGNMRHLMGLLARGRLLVQCRALLYRAVQSGVVQFSAL